MLIDRAKAIISFAIPFAFAACQLKSPGELLDTVPAPEFTSFSIGAAVGVISGETITLDLRWTGVDIRNQAAQFVTNAKHVQIGSASQISGKTMNDFSKTKKYLLVGADLSTRIYTVDVKFGYPFADTGQTLCSSGLNGDGGMAACPNMNTGTVQDGDHANKPTARSFTGPTRHATFTSDYTTTDNVTGLLWRSCSEGFTGPPPGCTPGSAGTYTWDTAMATTCSALNSANSGAGYAGRTTWRLPTLEELRTIINYGTNSPPIDTVNFPATVAAGYWTSSVYLPDTTRAWSVSFVPGSAGSIGKTGSLSVRCVAAEPAAYAPPRTDNGDGTVVDLSNNLVWQKCSQGQANDATCSGSATTATWLAAFNYCQGLSLAGRVWRLPNAAELSSLVDYTVTSPTINNTLFPGTVANYYWSSTTYVLTPTSAFSVTFSIGGVISNTKATAYNTRCVSGP